MQPVMHRVCDVTVTWYTQSKINKHQMQLSGGGAVRSKLVVRMHSSSQQTLLTSVSAASPFALLSASLSCSLATTSSFSFTWDCRLQEGMCAHSTSMGTHVHTHKHIHTHTHTLQKTYTYFTVGLTHVPLQMVSLGSSLQLFPQLPHVFF